MLKRNGRTAGNQWIIKRISSSGLFDFDHYASSADKSFENSAASINHYITKGVELRIDPHPLFSTGFYLETYPDIADAGVNPLDHYIQYGAQEMRDPHPLIKTSYILSQLEDEEDQKLASANPLGFYLDNPFKVNPVALFAGQFYRGKYMEGSDQHPLIHYLATGSAEYFDPHPLFDTGFFFEENPGIKQDVPALLSYILAGAANLECHRLFDGNYYLAKYEDAITSGLDALSHYLLVGSGSHYWPNPLFWPSYYERSVGSEIQNFDSALTHFVQKGWMDGVNPCPGFDLGFYTDAYPWTIDEAHTPLGHYLESGWRHELLPSADFSPKFVRSSYGVPEDANPLAYYIENHSGKPTLPEKAWSDPVPEYEQREVVASFFNDRVQDPEVSVIVPVYNNFTYTLRCLYSIAISDDRTAYEVIVADDQSTDETNEFFSRLAGLTYIKNPQNLGFLRSCNNAAGSARGNYLYFLNNDTAVLPGWLDSLVETFSNESNVGLVGSKLLYPNGLLQEAGGILWQDGAANFGKFDDPNRPEYSYLRDVDYVSGAAIMVRTDTWESLGGFDDRYAPAYCEDSDLCLSIRNVGLRVMMQPASKVVHFEGISNGTDTSSGIKQYQVRNMELLAQKWRGLLAQNGHKGDFSRPCVDRKSGPRLLIIDAVVPTPDQDAGSLTLWYFLKIFRQLGYQITFMPTNLADSPRYTAEMQKLGVECLHRPYVNDVNEYLEYEGSCFDLVMLYRVSEGGRFYEVVRRFAPQSKIIFDTVDLHFLREHRQASLEKDKELAASLMGQAAQTKERELYLIRNSDCSIVLSEYEKTMLERDFGIRNSVVIPIVLENQDQVVPYAEREGIAFVGGFQHTPNVDSVEYFVENLLPEIRERIPGLKFYVIGSKPPPELFELSEGDRDIIVTGFVESLDPYLNSVRLTIAPLRFGAGIKGKIGSSLSYGVPCIASKIGSEGMGLTHGQDVLMSTTDAEFADHVVEAYEDAATWEKLSKNGLEFIEDRYSIGKTRGLMLAMLNSLGVPPFVERCPLTGSPVTVRLVKPTPTEAFICSEHGSSYRERLVMAGLSWVISQASGSGSSVPLTKTEARIGLLPGCGGMLECLTQNGIISGADAGCEYYVGIYDTKTVREFATEIREKLGHAKVVVGIHWDPAGGDAVRDLIETLDCLSTSPVLIAKSSDDVVHSRVFVYDLIDDAPVEQLNPVQHPGA